MMRKVHNFALALLLSSTAVAPAFAQDTSAISESTATEDKMSVATRIAAKILPEGSYTEAIMQSFVGTDENGDNMMLQMFNFPMPADAEKKMSTGKTMLDVMEEEDPFFRERMSITMRIFGEEMRPLFLEMEPMMRGGIAAHLSKTMSYEDLIALEMFIATPAGANFAGQILPMWTSPEMMEVSASLMPAMMEIFPKIFARIEEETSHLPKPERYEEEGYYEEEEAEAPAE